MNLYQDFKTKLEKKYLQCISLVLLLASCESWTNSRPTTSYQGRTNNQYRQYNAPTRSYNNPYNNPYPASRRYYDPYQFRQTPSPYGGQNPYYDYDQYYVPPSQYYNNEDPGLLNSITSNKS